MIICGDCLDVMPTLDPNSIDSIVTDPPYGLSFMGKAWDHGIPGVEFWTAALRIAKPGAHLLAFGGTRTYHRLACAIEDAGWEIRDCIGWTYGSGFPKSLNLGDGRGTALKPAWEPIVMARKPLVGTVAENVATHGTGVINVDACRIGFANEADKAAAAAAAAAQRAGQDQNVGRNAYGNFNNGPASIAPYIDGLDRGRWPANLIHDGSAEVVALFPESDGQQASNVGFSHKNGAVEFGGLDRSGEMHPRGDSGSSARFFYCAKATRQDREEGLDRYLQVSYAEPSWVNAVLIHRLLAVTGLSPEKVTEGSTIRDNNGSAWSTCWCGSLSTDPFHPDISSIIAMKISSTIPSTTCELSVRPHTNGCMAVVFGKMANGGSLASCAGSSSPWARKTGTLGKKAGRSMEGADLATSVESWLRSNDSGMRQPDESRDPGSPGGNNPRNRGSVARLNPHPCVKPTSLMRYLCKLVTPAGGTILDPFSGSGSTGKAAVLERFDFVGIEREPDFCAIGEARIAWAESHRKGKQLDLLGETP